MIIRIEPQLKSMLVGPLWDNTIRREAEGRALEQRHREPEGRALAAKAHVQKGTPKGTGTLRAISAPQIALIDRTEWLKNGLKYRLIHRS